jgi:hypothetical protein
MRRAWLAAAVAALAVALVVLGTVGGSRHGPRRVAPAEPSPAAVQFGANVNWLFDDFSYTTPEIAAQLAALHASGATLARTDSLWEASEPTAPSGGVHHFTWAFDDKIATMLAEHGLRWLPIIDYSAPWAESTPGVDHSPPSSFADYAAYAGALAARYGAGGTFWRAHPDLTALPVQLYEVWNEPDNPEFWAPRPDAAAYARLYAAARAAILAADPSARVLVGGLTLPARFLPAMLAAMPALAGRIDGVAIHPYGVDPAAVMVGVRGARSALDSLGMRSVPLYVTEFGWTTSPPGALDYAPAALRPGYIDDTLAALGASSRGCGIGAVTLYTWTTPQGNARNSQLWFGISPPGASGSADVRAFANGLATARRTSAGGRC